jgi:hypothetical protein
MSIKLKDLEVLNCMNHLLTIHKHCNILENGEQSEILHDRYMTIELIARRHKEHLAFVVYHAMGCD